MMARNIGITLVCRQHATIPRRVLPSHVALRKNMITPFPESPRPQQKGSKWQNQSIDSADKIARLARLAGERVY
jgi:hypothetical protein